MKKITLVLLLFFIYTSINAQTVVWSSDLEDLTGWGINDLDGDGNNWGFYSGGGESFGFSPGAIGFSESWLPDPAPGGTALTPDNLLYTPTFTIPANATSISFKIKVAALDSGFFEENFAILVYDDNDFDNSLISIHEETLTSGGAGTAKDVTVSIPDSFSGKTIGIIIRHYDCIDQNQLLVDDFEVSFSHLLSTNDNSLEIFKAYPNPVKDVFKIGTKNTIDFATIINQLGQKVMSIDSSNIIDNSIDLSTLNSGLYFLTLKSEEKSATLKIIKQ